VIDHLAGPNQKLPGMVFLKGNHEDRMLAFLDEPAANGPRWMQFGGRDAFESYGIPTAQIDNEDWLALRDQLAAALPSHHLAFLRSLDLAVRWEGYLFIHAGPMVWSASAPMI
jgi:serine/threonine protein phosphatase 1